MANTTSNLTLIGSDWLLRQRPGMICQSHTRIYYMLLAYNAVSVIIAIISATPYFFVLPLIAKRGLSVPFIRGWRKLRRSAEGEDDESVHNPLSITSASLVLSTFGSLLIALSAPALTALSLWKQHRQQANLWVLIQQWSTRPRATCLMFPFMAIGASGYLEDSKEPQGFFVAVMTAMISEVPLSLLGIKFIRDQSRQNNPSVDVPVSIQIGFVSFPVISSKDPFVDLQFYTGQFLIAILVYAAIAAIPLISIFVLALVGPWLDDEGVYSPGDQKACLQVISILIWIPCTAIYAYSWCVWHSFLRLTPNELYCVADSKWIDLIYFLLPVFLGLWRSTAALLSRRRDKKSAQTATEMELMRIDHAAAGEE